MEKQTQKAGRDQVLREFPTVGKYRVRLLVDPSKPNAQPTLDIREFVTSESFEGFTRRGIRLSVKADLNVLRDVLHEVLGQAG